jgi:hypothetical protein
MKAKKPAKRVVKSSSAKAARSSMPAMKSAPKKSASTTTPLNTLLAIFGGFFLIHAVVIYTANMFFPEVVVLGTHMIPALMGLLYSSVVLTMVVVAMMPLIEFVTQAVSVKLQDWHWMGLYLVINGVALWSVARLPEMLGLGLGSWMVVAAMAVVINFLQGLAVKAIMK